MKDCLIKDEDKLFYPFNPKKVASKIVKSDYFVKLAKDKLANSNMPGEELEPATLQEDSQEVSVNKLGYLYRLILAIAKEGNVDLTARGIQNNLIINSQNIGLPISKGYVSTQINAILKYEEDSKK